MILQIKEIRYFNSRQQEFVIKIGAIHQFKSVQAQFGIILKVESCTSVFSAYIFQVDSLGANELKTSSQNDEYEDGETVDINSETNSSKRQTQNQNKYEPPVIGILTIPSGFLKYPSEKYSYIYASYIQFFQQGGARIIPLKCTESEYTLKKKMDQINGLILPGGGTNLMSKNEGGEKEFTSFSKVGLMLIEIAVTKNIAGNYFPIWGTCLGFELLLLSFSQSEIRNVFDCKNYFGKITLCEGVKGKPLAQGNQNSSSSINSRILNGFSSGMLGVLEKESFLYYNHKNSVSKKTFIGTPKLHLNFNCIAYGTDAKGKTFVAIAEAKNFPFFGTQFHPEKLQFDYSVGMLAGSSNSVLNRLRIVQHFANFFFIECLKNKQRFSSQPELQSLLIQNYISFNLPNYESSIFLFNNIGDDEYYKQNSSC